MPRGDPLEVETKMLRVVGLVVIVGFMVAGCPGSGSDSTDNGGTDNLSGADVPVGADISIDHGGGCSANCGEMVSIPGGTFQMGATDWSESQPVHSVTVPSFKMGKTEVTVAQYRSCVTAGTCTAPASTDFGCANSQDDAPEVCVTWDQSRAYCAWAGGRLCSESEWEYAARNGSAGNLYPWGDSEPTCDDAVWSGSGCPLASPAAGCSKSAGNNTWGVCDLTGNVWEWVEDDWHGNYTGAPTNGSAWVDSTRASSRVARGGCFYFVNPSHGLRGSSRASGDPSVGSGISGARCCESL